MNSASSGQAIGLIPNTAGRPPRQVMTGAVLLAAFAALALFTRLMCLDPHGWAPFWPANGAIVVALLTMPKRSHPYISALFLALNIAINSAFNYAPFHNGMDSVLNVFAGALLYYLMKAKCGAAIDLSRPRRFFTFLILCMVAAAIESLIGEVIYALTATPDIGLEDWLWWSICDGLGLAISVPPILLMVKRSADKRRYYKSYLKGMLISLAIAVLVAVSFLIHHSALLLFIYPLLILLAFTSRTIWVLTSVLLVSLSAAAFTVHGYGPFCWLAPSGSRLQQNVIQQFLVSLFICVIPASNAVRERGRLVLRQRRIHAQSREDRKAAIAANLAKSQFIANVSHEIRTPLNGIIGMAQALAAGADMSEIQRERVEIIQSSGQVLLSILNDVLDFSKIEAGKIELELAPIQIDEIAKAIQSAFSIVAAGKNIGLEVRLEGDYRGRHIGDVTRIKQIVSNLVSNALKFTASGSVELTVSSHDRGVSLAVRDTGIGIAANDIPNLFTKFQQADASITRRFGGTGLGLSICSELAHLMGGDIAVESVLGRGSTFVVHLPLERSDQAEAAAPDPNTAAFADGAGDLRILVAEDNPINQLVLKAFLTEIGVEATVVENGLQAVEACRDAFFDIILMDMQMPVMDGVTAVRKIRSAQAEGREPRSAIIAITADVMSHHIQAYQEAGIDAVAAKPLNFAELAQAIQDVLALDGQDQAEAEDPVVKRA